MDANEKAEIPAMIAVGFICLLFVVLFFELKRFYQIKRSAGGGAKALRRQDR
jgi:hypothetical protein